MGCGGDGDDGNGGIKVMEERKVKIHGSYRHFKNKYYIVEVGSRSRSEQTHEVSL